MTEWFQGHSTFPIWTSATWICSCCRGAGAWLKTRSNCSNNWPTAFWLWSVRSADLLSKQMTSVFPRANFSEKVCDQNNNGRGKPKCFVHKKLGLRWMALSLGMRVGLLGGEELVLWRLRRLSMEGDAWTVILCWKSVKGIMHIRRKGYRENPSWVFDFFQQTTVKAAFTHPMGGWCGFRPWVWGGTA